MTTLYNCGIWMPTKDCDPRAFGIFRRHYSYIKYKDHRRSDPKYRNRFSFVGPGQKLVLVTEDYDALFVWRKFKNASGQEGVNCAVFRNEGPVRASDLILEAEEYAWARWPGERLYTYVNPSAVRGTCPGYCFIRAKWKRCGHTKVNRLLVLEKYPGKE